MTRQLALNIANATLLFLLFSTSLPHPGRISLSPSSMERPDPSSEIKAKGEGVTYRYFPCLSRLFRTFPRPSGPPPNLPHLSRTSRTPSDPFLVFHRLPLPPIRFWTASTGSTGFHWLPHASAPSRGAIAMCLGVMARNSRGPLRPKKACPVPLCLGTLLYYYDHMFSHPSYDPLN